MIYIPSIRDMIEATHNGLRATAEVLLAGEQEVRRSLIKRVKKSSY